MRGCITTLSGDAHITKHGDWSVDMIDEDRTSDNGGRVGKGCFSVVVSRHVPIGVVPHIVIMKVR